MSSLSRSLQRRTDDAKSDVESVINELIELIENQNEEIERLTQEVQDLKDAEL